MRTYTVITEQYGEDGPNFDEHEFEADGHSFPDGEHGGFIQFYDETGALMKAFQSHNVNEIHVER